MAVRFDIIELSSTGHHAYPFISGVNNAQYLNIQTQHAYVHIGANNSSYAHFYTNSPSYYFNQPVRFDGNIQGYDGDETATFASFIDSNNTNYYVNPASGSVLGGTVTFHTDADSSVSIQNAGTNAVAMYAHSGDELYLGSNNQGTVRLHSGGMMELTVADTFYKYDGDKYARGFKNYQFYAGGGSYYSGGTHGWTKIANVTVTANCQNYTLHGKLYQRNYHDTAIINVSFVIRAECGFTSNNEDHFMENASTFAATSQHTDIDSSVRAVLIASSTNSRTYEIQFYEFAWNDNWYELWTSGGFSILDTPAAPTASTGTARLNNNSYGAAKVYYGTASMRSPIFYDLNDTNYYSDPSDQSRLKYLNLGTSPTSGITSGYIAQIRGHMHMTNNEINYVSQLHFNDNVRFYDEGNDSYLNFKFGDANGGGIKMINGSGTYHGMFYADGDTQIGILDKDNNWAVQVVRDSAVYLKVNDTTRFYVDNSKAIVPAGTMLKVGNSSTYNSDDSSWGSRLQVVSTVHARLDVGQDANAMRATLWAHTGQTGPFFGTSTNHPMNLMINGSEMGYYTTAGLCLSGANTHFGMGSRNYPKIVYPGKKAGWADNGSSTGEIIIHLPGTLANYDMMYMEIEVYEYSAKNATKIIVGGHNWNSGGNTGTGNLQWHNTGIKVIGNMDKGVYFGWRNDGTNNRRVVVIGDTSSSWMYAQVKVGKVSGTDDYSGSIDWKGDWLVQQNTTANAYTRSPNTNFNANTAQTLSTHGRMYAKGLLVDGSLIDMHNDRNFKFNGGSSSDVGLTGFASNGSHVFQLYGSGSNYGFLNGNWAAWDLMKTKNGRLYFNNNTSYWISTNETGSEAIKVAGGINTGEWIRINTSGTGVYWSGTGHHIYPANANNHLRIRSGNSTANYVSLSCANETPVGYLYGEVGSSSAHQIGILDSDGHWAIQHTNSGNTVFKSNNATKFTIASTGTVTATADVVAYSDERLKTNIETLDGSKVYEMRGVSFIKDDKEGSGVIAQELEKIAPELVNNDSEYKSVAYGNITGYLIEAVKELKAEIEELKKQIK